MKMLYNLLEKAASDVPQKGIVIVNNSQSDIFISYSELRDRSKKIAFVLQSVYQIEPGSKIVVSVERSEDFILLFWGSIIAGCVPILMPSVQFSNKKTIAFERLNNTIEIVGEMTLITSDI
ncbi:hypothetical protein HMPREF1981_00394, partial [Bacteroides pyogenes F0041]